MKHFKIFFFFVEKMNFVRMLNTSRKCCILQHIFSFTLFPTYNSLKAPQRSHSQAEPSTEKAGETHWVNKSLA